MKTTITLFLMLSTFSAFAGDILIFDRPSWNFYRATSISPEFQINKDMGRAWVNVTFYEGGEGDSSSEERFLIMGLSFNETSSQIQLDVDGVQIICANVKIRRFSTTIRPTGKCNFNQKYYTVKYDDGFEVQKVEKTKMTLTY